MAGLLRRRARGRGQQRDGSAAHRLPGARPRPGRPRLDQPDHLRRVAPTARCYCGADVDFVDIDPRTYNMSVAALARKARVAAERRAGCPRSSSPCISPASPATWRAIRALAERYGFRIIEDASHAVGGRYRGEPVGDCRYQRHHHVQLPSGQDHHDGRRRHGPDQRCRRSRSACGCCAQPWHHARASASPTMPSMQPPALVLRADRARIQLPHDRHPGGARRGQLSRLDEFVERAQRARAAL